MRDMCLTEVGIEEGVCPIADLMPELNDTNNLVVDIYDRSKLTANSVTSKDRKVYLYVKPSDVKALMDLYEVDSEFRTEMINRIYTIQDIENEARPPIPATQTSGSGGSSHSF